MKRNRRAGDKGRLGDGSQILWTLFVAVAVAIFALHQILGAPKQSPLLRNQVTAHGPFSDASMDRKIASEQQQTTDIDLE